MSKETKERLAAEVARIIGLPIIPMQPTAVHDSKPFPHLVQHGNGRLFLDGQLFDPLTQPAHFHLVEAWLVRQGLGYRHEYDARYTAHTFQIESGMTYIYDTRPLAGCLALVHQFGDDRLVNAYREAAVLDSIMEKSS